MGPTTTASSIPRLASRCRTTQGVVIRPTSWTFGRRSSSTWEAAATGSSAFSWRRSICSTRRTLAAVSRVMPGARISGNRPISYPVSVTRVSCNSAHGFCSNTSDNGRLQRPAAADGLAPRMNDAPPFLELRGIVKRFPGVLALSGVGLDVRPGEVHALLGENGAGKSTLIKTISGVYQADDGDIRIDGRPVHIRNPHGAQALGISTIYQEFTLAPDMTVAENVFLGREPLRLRALSIVDRKALVRQTRDVLAWLDLPIDPEATVKHLGVAQQQMVEIAKALSLDARLIIMDEPTAVLTSHETERLFDTIRDLKRRGVAIVYISHRLDEVKTIGDRATILRDGAYVATVPVASTTIDEMIRLMVGRDVKDKFPKVAIEPREEVLRVERLTRKGILHDISFRVRRGEILGIAGLVGSKRTETARAIFGADPLDDGRIFLHGKPLTIRTPADAIRNRIALVPEDRKHHGRSEERRVGRECRS